MVKQTKQRSRRAEFYAVIAELACVVAFVAMCVLIWSVVIARPSIQDTDQHVDYLVPKIVAVHDFDETSFTQGLEMADADTVLVGTGQYGQSRLYKSTLDGTELASVDLDDKFFGEGITQYGSHIWQLTWQEHTAIKRNAATLKETTRVQYDGEGWGLCGRDDDLIMSDGTAQLRVLDSETFAERDRITVRLYGKEVRGLNELECIGGDVYANIFGDTDIVRIDMDDDGEDSTGTVTAVIDASGLENRAEPDPEHVLNGIAAVKDSTGEVVDNRFLLSGKRWPDVYEVEFVSAK